MALLCHSHHRPEIFSIDISATYCSITNRTVPLVKVWNWSEQCPCRDAIEVGSMRQECSVVYLNVLLRRGVPGRRYALQLHRVAHQQLDQRRDLHLRHLVPSGNRFLDASYLRQGKKGISPWSASISSQHFFKITFFIVGIIKRSSSTVVIDGDGSTLAATHCRRD